MLQLLWNRPYKTKFVTKSNKINWDMFCNDLKINYATVWSMTKKCDLHNWMWHKNIRQELNVFSVLYTVRDNKGKRKDHIDQMEEDECKKVTLHYHPAPRKGLGRPCKNWQQICKMLGGLRHDRKTKSKLIIKMTCKLINHLVWINFILNF